MDTGKKIAIAIAVVNAATLVYNGRDLIGRTGKKIHTKFTAHLSK